MVLTVGQLKQMLELENFPDDMEVWISSDGGCGPANNVGIIMAVSYLGATNPGERHLFIESKESNDN